MTIMKHKMTNVEKLIIKFLSCGSNCFPRVFFPLYWLSLICCTSFESVAGKLIHSTRILTPLLLRTHICICICNSSPLKSPYISNTSPLKRLYLYLYYTWDENMHQEKKKCYGKFFDFCAEKCI